MSDPLDGLLNVRDGLKGMVNWIEVLLARVEPAGEELAAELRQLRSEMATNLPKLNYSDPIDVLAGALADHGLRLIDLALVGLATRPEVNRQIAAIERLSVMRLDQGDTRFVESTNRWFKAFYRLADSLPDEAPGPRSQRTFYPWMIQRDE